MLVGPVATQHWSAQNYPSYIYSVPAPEKSHRPCSYFPNKQALPASTLVQVPRLANPAFLLEIEAIAILPPKA